MPPCALQFYGRNEGETVVFGDKSAGKFGAFWVDGGKVVGAFLESGSPEENASLKKLALEEPPAPPTEHLAAEGLQFAAKLGSGKPAANLGSGKPAVKTGGCKCM